MMRASAVQIRDWYDRHVLPALLDRACGLAVIGAQRARVVPQARGRVLEIGFGTGLNLPFYDTAKVSSVVAVEPARQMHALATRRSQEAAFPVELWPAAAERLPFDASSFDSIVCTYTLCSVAEPAAALVEMRRVLRPDGQLFLAEHGLAPDRSVARWQRRIEPYWSRVAGGCHLTRDLPLLLREAGFRRELDRGYISWPRALGYNYWGAVKAA